MRKVLLIFSELTDADVDWLSKAGERIHLEAGTTLIPLGARLDSLWFVLDGAVSVHTATGAGVRADGVRRDHRRDVARRSGADGRVGARGERRDFPAPLRRHRARQDSPRTPPFAARFYRALCVFLASRLRATTRRMGYGDNTEDKDAKDELTDDLLDNVHLAGARFDRMLKRLAG